MKRAPRQRSAGELDLMLETEFDSNALLQRLTPSARARFRGRAKTVELRRGQVLHNQGEPAERVHFPLHGLLAILSETLAGESVQTGMVGCDGAIGAVEAIGSGQFLTKGLVQIPGMAVRLSAASYRELFDTCAEFRAAAERYVEMSLAEARQLMVCNALHSVESRLSRAILEALDRSCQGRVLPLTQDSIAQMLGAQRTTVAVLLSKLQRNGLIKNSRGSVEVRNWTGLERLACGCRETLAFARDEIEAPRVVRTPSYESFRLEGEIRREYRQEG